MMSDQNLYDALETPAITSILIDPERPHDTHMSALLALSQRSETHRTPGLISALRSMVRYGDSYNVDVMTGTVDALITDLSAEVTEAMLDVLPTVLQSALQGKDTLKSEFRERFYQALLTRQSDEDLTVWGNKLPELDGRTLAAAMLDPIAGPLEAIEPKTLIERLSEPERTKALVAVVVGVAQGLGSIEGVKWAVPLLRKSHDSEQLAQGLDLLGQHWEQAKKAGREGLAANLEKILGALDRRPRTAVERLAGKRPWAN